MPNSIRCSFSARVRRFFAVSEKAQLKAIRDWHIHSKAITFPMAFPNACYAVIVKLNNHISDATDPTSPSMPATKARQILC
ncbi:gp53-like domain-containing protein [Rahnella aceris]|uniref:gp53-like domain-containing protein n=1 Tax=Rahnella sp. (strain Y9602) TaxID=2703885 RepID=UPI003F5A793F